MIVKVPGVHLIIFEIPCFLLSYTYSHKRLTSHLNHSILCFKSQMGTHSSSVGCCTHLNLTIGGRPTGWSPDIYGCRLQKTNEIRMVGRWLHSSVNEAFERLEAQPLWGAVRLAGKAKRGEMLIVTTDIHRMGLKKKQKQPFFLPSNLLLVFGKRY